ncbi:unnamed protein product, partial [Allacma fusca]
QYLEAKTIHEIMFYTEKILRLSLAERTSEIVVAEIRNLRSLPDIGSNICVKFDEIITSTKASKQSEAIYKATCFGLLFNKIALRISSEDIRAFFQRRDLPDPDDHQVVMECINFVRQFQFNRAKKHLLLFVMRNAHFIRKVRVMELDMKYEVDNNMPLHFCDTDAVDFDIWGGENETVVAPIRQLFTMFNEMANSTLPMVLPLLIDSPEKFIQILQSFVGYQALNLEFKIPKSLIIVTEITERPDYIDIMYDYLTAPANSS